MAEQIIVALTAVSVLGSLGALGVAAWHHVHLEWQRHEADVPPDRRG